MSIQLFKPTFRVEECLEEIKKCLEIGWTGLGYKTVEFEEKWKEYTGLENAHFLNSATVGLHLAVKLLKNDNNWQEGDEIISSPITFVSTNHAVVYENLKVVFADVDEYLCLEPTDVEKKITNKTKAVIFVGLGGSTGQLEKIVEICKKHNLKLIVDAAHMSGTRFKGETPGKEADVLVYSFQAVKNLPTADSGMICFKDKKLDEICRQFTWLGINKDTYTRTNEKGSYKWKYEVDNLGFKYHGNSIMAAIALVQLKYLDIDNSYRRTLASWYDAGFSKANDKIVPVQVPPDCESSRHLYIIEVDDRDGLIQYLNDNDIYPGVHYRDNIEYSLYNYAEGTCPVARAKSKRILSLPMHLQVTKRDIDKIVETILHFVNE